MWKCVNCGEDENEDSYKFCVACGTNNPYDVRVPANEKDVEKAFDLFSDRTPQPSVELVRAEEPQAPPRRPQITNPIKALGNKVKSVLPINNGSLNHVKVSAEAQERLKTLVQAGVFGSKSDAAAYLIERGIKAEARLFEVVHQKLSEIERIETELRGLVTDEKK
ncbi:MAG TPA: zinc ribbon domain-containing protein [Pyrinomonadaceae bacterium]